MRASYYQATLFVSSESGAGDVINVCKLHHTSEQKMFVSSESGAGDVIPSLLQSSVQVEHKSFIAA